jgi:hypothetical protein
VNAVVWLASSSNLGVRDVMSKQEVQIYPNPVSDYVYIKNNKFKTYQLLDEMGRVIDSG